MQSDCYRCGGPVEEKAAFCPACNAPQIRVASAPAEQADLPPDQEPDGSPAPASPLRGLGAPGLHWGLFFRIASPVAALTGLLSVLFLPAGLFLMLPFGVRRAISRYRPHHAGPLDRAHCARLGTFTALLSYLSFFIFFLATISLNREALIQRAQESAQKNPGPQAEEVLRLLSTNEGFTTIAAIVLIFFLVLFLLVGVASGALAVPSASSRKRP
jgi:hypothetical protein